MEPIDKWSEIRQVFESANKSCLHVAMATVDSEGSPHVTPIGSLILRDNCSGFYFEEFPVQLSDNLRENNRVTVLALNSDLNYWLESLTNGKFDSFPGVRLMGTVSEIRDANQDEIDIWQEKVAFAKGLKGHKIMWSGMKRVRDITFDGFKPVYCGGMTSHLD